MEPRQVDELPGQEVRFREAIQLGHTHLSEKEVRELIVAMGREYNGCDYNILHRSAIFMMQLKFIYTWYIIIVPLHMLYI